MQKLLGLILLFLVVGCSVPTAPKEFVPHIFIISSNVENVELTKNLVGRRNNINISNNSTSTIKRFVLRVNEVLYTYNLTVIPYTQATVLYWDDFDDDVLVVLETASFYTE